MASLYNSVTTKFKYKRLKTASQNSDNRRICTYSFGIGGGGVGRVAEARVRSGSVIPESPLLKNCPYGLRSVYGRGMRSCVVGVHVLSTLVIFTVINLFYFNEYVY